MPLLQYLKKELNLPGLIYVYEHRQEARLAIVKLEDTPREIIKVEAKNLFSTIGI